MLLAVDIGNTSIKFGVFAGDRLMSRNSIPTTAAELSQAIASLGDVSSAIICSVVPARTKDVSDAILERIGIEVRLLTNHDDLGLRINYEPLDAAGTDRLVSAFAAAELFGVPVIVCSFGTATTIDIVNRDRELLGGLIAPGMATAARALHLNAARLPEVRLGPINTVINQTTETSIKAGLLYSQVGLVEAVVQRMRTEVGTDAKVIATGGFARMVSEHSNVIDVVDDDLLLKGLQMLSERLDRLTVPENQ
ncbi:MAG: type III pantothenate kinase [Chloracidobacterium sp.]|nr:type III pantothenate kinase [Chloracidobacterium sp.]